MRGNNCKHTACMQQKAASDPTSQIPDTLQMRRRWRRLTCFVATSRGRKRPCGPLFVGRKGGLSVVSFFWRCVAFLLPITRRGVPATETPPGLANLSSLEDGNIAGEDSKQDASRNPMHVRDEGGGSAHNPHIEDERRPSHSWLQADQHAVGRQPNMWTM